MAFEPYYFDMLPVRLSILWLEGLTSYLIRSAEANGITSVDGVSAIFFPEQSRRITRELSDYLPVSVETLRLVTGRTQEELLQTTFFHVSRKFGRSAHPQATSRFLSGMISKSLRFCPQCLLEQGYYRLYWRFGNLEGCPVHRCRLLDMCPSCGTTIPIFKAPFRIGFCPRCGGDFRLCKSTQLEEENIMTASLWQRQLEFLLLDQEWETRSRTFSRPMGRKLAQLRYEQGLSSMDAAKLVGITLTAVEGIERGNTWTRGAGLGDYLKYATYFGLQLQELFSMVTDENPFVGN